MREKIFIIFVIVFLLTMVQIINADQKNNNQINQNNQPLYSNEDGAIEFNKLNPSNQLLLYSIKANQDPKMSIMNPILPMLLWKNILDIGLSYHNSLFSSKINDDNFPDFLSNNSVLDGKSGELIWKNVLGKICGVGDVNNDGYDEVFLKKEGGYNSDYSNLFCLDATNGSVIWNITLNCTLIFNPKVGNLVYGSSNNEILVPTGDWVSRNNQKVYCLNGLTGDIIWEKHTINRAICAAIDDVNNDGKNDAIVSNWERRLYCLNGENGSVVWEISGLDAFNYRTITIGELNDDPYKEIILESGYGIRCQSGFNGSTLWTWKQPPDAGWKGSFQSMKIVDMIPEIPGNEVIACGVCGVYCLRNGNNYTNDSRMIWHAGKENGILPDFVMSSAIGDLNQDGLLDIAAISDSFPPYTYGKIYAINGQQGTRLWVYDNCGGTFNTLICTDVTGDNHPEVIAKDDSFVCALLSYNLSNINPDNPNINGIINGEAGTSYIYSFATIDQDGDDMYYYIDWGDNSFESWIGPYSSGEEINLDHLWSEQGTYIIKAKARDIHGYEGDWGTLEITMPLNNNEEESEGQSTPSGTQRSNPISS
jgi:outer membrane protein assembly factor BamB